MDKDPLNAGNLHYLRMSAGADGEFGVSNEGFRGIGVRQGGEYNFSVSARRVGDQPVTLRIELVNAEGKRLGSTKVSGFTQSWKRYTGTLHAAATEAKAQLQV